jgi:hypothetical protein
MNAWRLTPIRLASAVDRMKQIDGKIDVHALDFTPRTTGFCQVEMSSEVLSSMVHFVQTSGATALVGR